MGIRWYAEYRILPFWDGVFHTKKYAFKERREEDERQTEQIKAQALEQIKAPDMPEKLNEVRKISWKKRELTAIIKGNERRWLQRSVRKSDSWSMRQELQSKSFFRRDKSENGGSHP